MVTSMPKIATQWQRFEQLSAAEVYEILRFRQSIFVVEQRSPYPDLDGLDQNAWHLLGRVDGDLASYLRLVLAPLRIGRVAVAAHLRRHGLGRQLMAEALRFCHELNPDQTIVLASQLALVPFYENFGFAVVSEPYDDFGVLHADMQLHRPASAAFSG
jgi:ElaA protein